MRCLSYHRWLARSHGSRCHSSCGRRIPALVGRLWLSVVRSDDVPISGLRQRRYHPRCCGDCRGMSCVRMNRHPVRQASNICCTQTVAVLVLWRANTECEPTRSQRQQLRCSLPLIPKICFFLAICSSSASNIALQTSIVARFKKTATFGHVNTSCDRNLDDSRLETSSG